MSFLKSVFKAVAGPLVGGVLGGATTAYGQIQANRNNERIARQQMDFQERMSNTAYQRAPSMMSCGS